LENFSQQISHRSSKLIKQLLLDFSENKNLTGSEAELLMNGISQKFQNLQNLFIDFSCSLIPGHHWTKILTIIFDQIKGLKSFILLLNGCDISNCVLQNLFLPLRKAELLEHLYLDLQECNQIADIGILSIANTFRESFPKLKKLSLCFGSSDNITNEGLKILVQGICKSLKNIDQLLLSFRGCSALTDDGIEEVGKEILSYLPLLNQLYVNFTKLAQRVFVYLFKRFSANRICWKNLR